PEARELARHSDVNMTMRYTHIGIEDQAKALGQLPWTPPAAPGGSRGEAGPSADGLQRNGSVPGVPACHNGASGDTGEAQPGNDDNPRR
ncbi:MAG TPA: hypothetical protein VKP69_33385, partial [Isosphaeraceae bacterium]|nr:hypothetical protein [Isosphaeraceae bacterium]